MCARVCERLCCTVFRKKKGNLRERRELVCGKMVRRVVVPPAHQSSNLRFDVGVSHLGGIFFSGRRRSRRQRGARGDFVNFKTQPSAQSLGGAHKGRVCVRAFIGVSVCACI